MQVRTFQSSAKAQAAMEYLMTYGWAILAIGIVLGALYSLGIFNSLNLAPKAQPGGCQVFRPDGPNTTSFISLEGVCNGELPEYVADFNGQSSYISLNSQIDQNVYCNLTTTAWSYDTSMPSTGSMGGVIG
ncbi:MAG: hypothetical protein QXF01_02190, partial [Candidatus Micrarchaeaceae archaeon]